MSRTRSLLVLTFIATVGIGAMSSAVFSQSFYARYDPPTIYNTPAEQLEWYDRGLIGVY